MKNLLSPRLVSSMLAAHSLVGLLLAALIYLLCLSGTLLVIGQELAIQRLLEPTSAD